MGLSRVAFGSTAVALLIICTHSTVIYNDNNLILGSRQDNDSLVFMSLTEINPNDGIVIEQTMVTISTEFYNLTYVEAFEYGDYPDARATLIGGGPNFNHVSILLSTGTSRGLNYTINLYGLEINTDKTVKKAITSTRTDYFL